MVTLPLTESGKSYRDESTKWYVQYKDEHGTWQREPGYTDKEATHQLASELERKVERRRAGLTDPFEEHHSRSLAEHLNDYRQHLEAKENTEDHVQACTSRVSAILQGCRLDRIGDVTATKVEGFLVNLRREGLSTTSSNHYLTAIKGFFNWMVRNQRVPANPLVSLSRLNTETDIRRERRTVTLEEFASIVEAAGQGKTSHRLSGDDRMWLYIVASQTGLRAKELASLTPQSFDLASKDPTVAVMACYSKRRRRDEQPLREDVAAKLKGWLVSKTPQERLWPGKWYRRVRKDLTAAGIPYRDDNGQVFDFHAIRHFYITELARSGVYPKVVQTLARHSTITLTMDRYTHLNLADQRAALDSLPEVLPVSSRQVGTGTDGPSKSVAQGVAQTFGISRNPPPSGGNAPPKAMRRSEERKSLPEEANEACPTDKQFECERGDLNPHELCSLDPKSSASANSATLAGIISWQFTSIVGRCPSTQHSTYTPRPSRSCVSVRRERVAHPRLD